MKTVFLLLIRLCLCADTHVSTDKFDPSQFAHRYFDGWIAAPSALAKKVIFNTILAFLQIM